MSPVLLKVGIKVMPYLPNALVKSMVFPIYCGGETSDELLATGRKLLDRGIGNMMLSYSVEDAEGTAADETFAESLNSICKSVTEVLVPQAKVAERLYQEGAISTPPASGYVALKPTGLMKNAANILANYNKPAYAEQWSQYLDVCRHICNYAVAHGNDKVVIVFDAEKQWLQDGVYAAQRQMMDEYNRDGKVIVCGTLQLYLQGSVDFLKQEIELARTKGYQVAMKLVRGAYMHSEPDRDNVIHTSKANTDKSFDDGVNVMLDHIVTGWKTGETPVGRVVIASHNVDSTAKADRRIAAEAPLGFDLESDESVVFGQLMGMQEDQSEDLARQGRKVVKYVPWGPVDETKDYLTRRLEENGDAARSGVALFKECLREISARIATK